jgi:signal transduction histidine kinase
MNIFALTCFVTGTLAGFTGFFVFLKGVKQRLNQLWFIFNLSIAVWLVGLGGTLIVNDPVSALIWQKVLYVGTIFIPFLFLHFCVFLTGRKFNKLFKANSFLTLFFTLTLFIGNLFVKAVKPVTSFGYWPVDTGQLYYPFLFWYSVNVVYGFVLLKKKLQEKDLDQNKRKQISIIYYGTMIGFIFGSVNFLLDFNIIFPPFHNFFVSGYLVFTALAIARYNLFEIRVILTEILVVATDIILFIQAFIAETLLLKVFGFLLFVIFSIFGYQLIRSVIREIELRGALELAYGELKKLDDAKSEFISIASHQLRTPLTAVKGYISMILEKSYGEVPDKMGQPLENVYASNERLIGLVNDILNISKIEAGKMEMEWEKASLQDLILDIINELKVKADAKDLYLKYEKPEIPIPDITIDKTKIRQVILNIIDNSIKYTEHGGTTVKIQKPNSKVQIIVSDTGIGLEKEDIPRLFESFSRGRNGSIARAEGTGLGLYIARRFIEMHKGKIWAESEGKGKGSTFFIELPIK